MGKVILMMVGGFAVWMLVCFLAMCAWDDCCKGGGVYPHSGFCPDFPVWCEGE